MSLSEIVQAILRLFQPASPTATPPAVAPSSIESPTVSLPASPTPDPTRPSPVVSPVMTPVAPTPTTSAASHAAPSWIDIARPLTQHFEQCYLIAYPDPASPLAEALRARSLWQRTLEGSPIPADLAHLDGAPWTCGYGCTGADIHQGTVWTQAHADSQLTLRLNQAADAVDRHVTVELTPAQKAALVDFVFNEGEGNFASSTLLRLLNASDFVHTATQFAVWDLARGKVLVGLQERRAAENTLFTTGKWSPA